MITGAEKRPPCRRLLRTARDFLLGLALFAVVAMTGIAGTPGSSGFLSNSAHARYFEIEPVSPTAAMVGAVGQSKGAEARALRQHLLAVSSLALAFATAFAFNIWLARHLRRVHASDRRRRR